MLTGDAALVAGALSIGAGEYISVTSQNEPVHAEVAVERRMHARFPAAEEAELAEYFRGYGADPDTAARMAAAVSTDPGTALRPPSAASSDITPPEPVTTRTRRAPSRARADGGDADTEGWVAAQTG